MPSDAERKTELPWVKHKDALQQHLAGPTVHQLNRKIQELDKLVRLQGKLLVTLLLKSKGKPGPKGPHQSVTKRRAIIVSLNEGGIKGRDACQILQEYKILLPSKKLRILYENHKWLRWLQTDPSAFHKQWSSDVKRAAK